MSKETLALMLSAEQRDYPWVQVLAEENNSPPEGFTADTVVDCVKQGLEFDEQIRGEIDPVGQEHFLRGPNAFDEQDLINMEWEAKTEAANR